MPQLYTNSKNVHSYLRKYFKKSKVFHLFSYFHDVVQLSQGKADICEAFLQIPFILIIPYYKKEKKKQEN